MLQIALCGPSVQTHSVLGRFETVVNATEQKASQLAELVQKLRLTYEQLALVRQRSSEEKETYTVLSTELLAKQIELEDLNAQLDCEKSTANAKRQRLQQLKVRRWTSVSCWIDKKYMFICTDSYLHAILSYCQLLGRHTCCWLLVVVFTWHDFIRN